MKYDLTELMKNDGFVCPSCGRRHFGGLRDCVIRRGALSAGLPLRLRSVPFRPRKRLFFPFTRPAETEERATRTVTFLFRNEKVAFLPSSHRRVADGASENSM